MNVEFGRLALVLLFAIIPVVGIALGINSPGLRARIPLLVAFFAGAIPIISLYVPKKFLSGPTGMSPRLDQWLIIVYAFAILLGVVNVLQNSTRKIARRESGWPFSIVLLVGLFATGGAGIYGQLTKLRAPAGPASQFDLTRTENLYRGGVNGGAGFAFNLNDTRLKIFLEARYHHIFTPGSGGSLIPGAC